MILKKQISIHQINRVICTPRRDVKSFFQNLLAKNVTLQSMWQALGTYWTFYNYTLFEKLVANFGDETLTRSLAHYATVLSEFQKKTQLSDFARYSIIISKDLPEDSFVDVVVELNSEHLFLKDLDNLSASVCGRFSLPRFIPILKSIHPHANTVTWAIPVQFLKQLRNTSETCPPDLSGNHTIRTVGGKQWKYSPSDDQKLLVHSSREEPTLRGKHYMTEYTVVCTVEPV